MAAGRSSISKYDLLIVSWVEAVLRRPWRFIVGPVVLMLGLALGAAQLTLDKSYRAYFDDDDPSLLNYDALVRALRLMRMDMGIGLGGRRITVSPAHSRPWIQ